MDGGDSVSLKVGAKNKSDNWIKLNQPDCFAIEIY